MSLTKRDKFITIFISRLYTEFNFKANTSLNL